MDLKAKYGKKYRVTTEDSFEQETDTESRRERWRYYEIRGKHGSVFPYSFDKLAVTFTSIQIANRFDSLIIMQNGETERTCLIPSGGEDAVIRAIRPRNRRQLSEATKIMLRERLSKLRKPAEGAVLQRK